MSGEREPLLERVALGELAPDDPQVRSRAGRDEAFRRQLEELVELQGDLEVLGEERRADLAEAAQAAPLSSEQRIEGLVRELGGRGGRARGARHVPHLLWAAAAAAVVLILAWRPWSGEPPSDIVLGVSFADLEPSGAGADFARFRWTYELEAGGFFVVRVYDRGTGERIAESRELTEPSWSPDPERRADWPRNIRWEVHAYTAMGTFADSAEARAER